MLEAPIWSGWT